MPESYEIDRGRALVVCRAWGEFTNRDLLEHYRRLMADPDFDPTFAQLADLRGVTDYTVESEQIESAARKEVFAPGTPRAFVAPRGVGFGLARMFASYAPHQEDVHVFERLTDAERWLADARHHARGSSGR